LAAYYGEWEYPYSSGHKPKEVLLFLNVFPAAVILKFPLIIPSPIKFLSTTSRENRNRETYSD